MRYRPNTAPKPPKPIILQDFSQPQHEQQQQNRQDTSSPTSNRIPRPPPLGSAPYHRAARQQPQQPPSSAPSNGSSRPHIHVNSDNNNSNPLSSARLGDVVLASAPIRRPPPEPKRVNEFRKMPWWKRAAVDPQFRRQLVAAVSSAQRLLEEHVEAIPEPWHLPAPDRSRGGNGVVSNTTTKRSSSTSNNNISSSARRPATVGAEIDGNIRHITRTLDAPVGTQTLQHRPATARAASANITAAATTAFSRNSASELALLDAATRKVDVALSRGEWTPYSATNRAPGDGPTYRWIGDFPPAGFHISYSHDMTRINGLEAPMQPSFETIGTTEVPAGVAVFATEPRYPLMGGVVVPKDAMCLFLVSESALKEAVPQKDNNDDVVDGDNEKNSNNLARQERQQTDDDTATGDAVMVDTGIIKTSEGGAKYKVFDRDDPTSVIRAGLASSSSGGASKHSKKSKQRRLPYCIPIVDKETAEKQEKERRQRKNMLLSHFMDEEEKKEQRRKRRAENAGGGYYYDDDESSSAGSGDNEEGEEEEEDETNDNNNEHNNSSGDHRNDETASNKRRRRKKSHRQMLKEKFKGLLPTGAVGFAFGAPKFIAYLWPSHRLVRFRLLSAALLKIAQDERNPSLAAGFEAPSNPLASYLRPDLSDNRIEFLFSSDPCRESVQKIFEKLPKDAHNRLEQKSFIAFTLDLYNLYMPLYSDRTNFLLAEAEWAARGVRDDTLDFILFFWFFFDFPLFLMRDGFIREVDYVEFWDFTYEQIFVKNVRCSHRVNFDDVMALRSIEDALSSRVSSARLANRAHVELQLLKSRQRHHERRTHLLLEEKMRIALEKSGVNKRRNQEQQQSEQFSRISTAASPAEFRQQPEPSSSGAFQRVSTAAAQHHRQEQQHHQQEEPDARLLSPQKNQRAHQARQMLSFREYLASFDNKGERRRELHSSADDDDDDQQHEQQQQQQQQARTKRRSQSPRQQGGGATDNDNDEFPLGDGGVDRQREGEEEEQDLAVMLLASDPDAPENNVEQLLDYVEDMSDSDLEETDAKGRLVIFDRFRLSREIRRRRDDRNRNAEAPPTRLIQRSAMLDLAREKEVIRSEMEDRKAERLARGEQVDDDDDDADGDKLDSNEQEQGERGAVSLRVMLRHAAEEEEMQQDEDDDLAAAAQRRRRVARMLTVRRRERTRLQELAQSATQLRKVNRYTMFGAPMLKMPNNESTEISRSPRQVLKPPLDTGRISSARPATSSGGGCPSSSSSFKRVASLHFGDNAGGVSWNNREQHQQQQADNRNNAENHPHRYRQDHPGTELALPLMGGTACSKIGVDAQLARDNAGGATESHVRAALLYSGTKMDLGGNIQQLKVRERRMAQTLLARKHELDRQLLQQQQHQPQHALERRRAAESAVAARNAAASLNALLYEQQHTDLDEAKRQHDAAQEELRRRENEEDQRRFVAFSQQQQQQQQQEEHDDANVRSSPAAVLLSVHGSQLGDTLPYQRLPQPVVLPRRSSLDRIRLASQQSARNEQRAKTELFDFKGHPMKRPENRSNLFLASHGRDAMAGNELPHPDMQFARWLTAVQRHATSSPNPAPF